MITATLQEAKATLSRLVEEALAGKDVVLLRGSRIVVRLQPISEEDLEICPQLSDTQAQHFWKEVKNIPTKTFQNPTATVSALKRGRKRSA